MDAYRLKIEKYDPFYFPWDIEENVGKYDIITCNYVLNVLIPDDVEVVLYQIYRLLKVGGRAYITVRRGKLAEGKTSKGFQYSVVLPKFKSIRRTSSYEIYEMVGGA
jgi:ubiquinone/menaquinone biosynthesis C-methylase UbiE